MAEAEQVLGLDAIEEAARVAAKKELWRMAERRTRGAGKSGAERLHLAANKKVAKNSEKLTDMLMDEALKGSVACARILVGLVERTKPEEIRKKRRGLSQAQMLELEPQWSEPEEGEELGARD